MYVLLVGDIEIEIYVEYLPNLYDYLFISGKTYQISARLYNPDLEQWALRLEETMNNKMIPGAWREENSKPDPGELYIDDYIV